jgi:TonB-linked SusC/RagA family outer membrane protein
MGTLLIAAQALAQQVIVTGKVTSDQGAALAGAQIVISGTSRGTLTNNTGLYSIRAAPGETLQFSYLGMTSEARTVGTETVINVQLRTSAVTLQGIVVTALGQTASRRSLGTSQQTVGGADVAGTQRENFVNALQGRVAGVDVTSTSGLPGASSSITIRGVSSISSSNQPLFVIDGLPVDNKTLSTLFLASDVSSNTALSNRGIDFTNRAADFNSEDIASITVLKGPAAAALYGIDAANGAIVITTKRGRLGVSGFDYAADFKIEGTRGIPEIQNTYGPSGIGSTSLQYFGTPYPAGTRFYNNVNGFFQTALTQHHNLAFSGATPDGRINYRLSAGTVRQRGVIPTSTYNRINVTAASQAQAMDWLNVDGSMQYAYDTNNQPLTANGGPLLGLLAWPDTVDASNWLTPAGTRLRLTTLSAGSEMDNPYFSVNKNHNLSRNSRITVNVGLKVMPFSWGYLKTNIGTDNYTNQYEVKRDPQSSLGYSYGGILDATTDFTRNITAQTLLNINSHPVPLLKNVSISGFVGNTIRDERAAYDVLGGTAFMDPNFTSINNTLNRTESTQIIRRRLVSAFGQAVLNYKDYLYLTGTGRNDWTSTIPVGANSFFYPSISSSFVFTDAFPAAKKLFSNGKVRVAYAAVGRDASPYAYAPSLEYKTTSYAGYGAGFYGPNPNLKPEFAKSWEFGTELSFLNDRLGVDATAYQKRTEAQIVQNVRGSYGTGFILFNLNGATTRNRGLELTVRGRPLQRENLSWDIIANWALARGKVLYLPHGIPESYVSDTWLYGNVRNGTMPGLSTMSLTGLFWLTDTASASGHKGELLIDPSTGLPIQSAAFIDRGYDRQPTWTAGLVNTINYKRFSLEFLTDIRYGGDVFDATDHWLTARGLNMGTLDRERPRVIKGILRDGKENTANPTANTIVVVPAVNTGYYTAMSEEMFIEKHINWIRLKDVTLSYAVDPKLIRARSASVFLTVTDPVLLTNYTGLDPIVNGNDAAVGGSSGVGIDYGNFPIPRGINFGFRVGF